jgi:hypothetical protein
MASVLIGGVAMAFALASTYKLTKKQKTLLSNQSILPRGDTRYIYQSAQEPRSSDEYMFKHTGYEADTASPAYQDQTWSWDCGVQGDSCDSIIGNAPPGEPPIYGEHLPYPVGEMGSVLDEIQYNVGKRDASVELNPPPERMKKYACHPMDYGGQLMPHEIPHGAQESTDEEFWGPRDWDAERHSRVPTYVDFRTNELDGKEINRPLDDYGWQVFDEDDAFAANGAVDVDFAGGQSTARTPEVRLLARNRYGGIVSNTTAERPKFLPPTIARAGGGGQPAIDPEITMGARINRTFEAINGGRNGHSKAPPEMAEITLSKSKRLLYTPRKGLPTPRAGSKPSGPDDNPIRGIRISKYDDFRRLPAGIATPRTAAYGGCDVNPHQGQHYTSREHDFTWDDNTVGKSRMGGNGYLLMNEYQREYRQRKNPEDMVNYSSIPGKLGGSYFNGEESVGICIPKVKTDGVQSLLISRGGGKNILTDVGYINMSTITKQGLKGGVWDNTPETQAGFKQLNTPQGKAIIGGRTKEALDDLFDIM